MSDNPEKRMLESYEIIHSIDIGDKQVVFGQDEKKAMPYVCAFYTRNALFCRYEDCVLGDDYVEMMELFSERVKEQCEKVREERAKVTVPREKITAEMCEDENRGLDINGKIVAIKADALRPEYRSIEHQLVYVVGGNGARGNAIGSTCYCRNLYSGEKVHLKRYDIQGVVKAVHLPIWAEEKLCELQAQKEQGRHPPVKNEKEQEVR